MTILLVILGIILYVFVAVLYYGLNERYNTIYDDLNSATCWIWPIAWPVLLLGLLGKQMYNLIFKND